MKKMNELKNLRSNSKTGTQKQSSNGNNGNEEEEKDLVNVQAKKEDDKQYDEKSNISSNKINPQLSTANANVNQNEMLLNTNSAFSNKTPPYNNQETNVQLANQSINIRQSIEMDERMNESKQSQSKKPNQHIEIEALDEDKAKNLLITELPSKFDNRDLYTFHDLIVPGGKNAKLCLVNEPFNKNLRVSEIVDHFGYYEPTPTIVLIGANTKNKIKLFAGLSRAALNCRAVIIDSGLQTGLERFCLRKNIDLIGIAPECQIEYPKVNPEPFSNTMLTNGHTHFILLGKDDKGLKWGKEAKFKVNFVERFISGRRGGYAYKSRAVGIILGNIPNCTDEIMMFMEKNWPMILIEDSDLAQEIKDARGGGNESESYVNQKVNAMGKYSKIIEIDGDSENLAASIHICLTLSF